MQGLCVAKFGVQGSTGLQPAVASEC